MPYLKQIIVFPVLAAISINANAQLFRYLDRNSAPDIAQYKAIEQEACSIVTRYAIVYADTVPYKVMDYVIQAFDGSCDKITLFEQPSSHTLYIGCPHDSLKIEDLYCLTKVHFFRPDLLEVVYSPRVGSDEGYDNVLILGINKGKLCILMHVRSVDEYYFSDDYKLYNLRLSLRGIERDQYHLGVSIHEILRSTTKVSKNYDRNSKYVLKFDERQKIFYNEVRHLHPMINLGEYQYYFVDHRWYMQGEKLPGKKPGRRMYEM